MHLDGKEKCMAVWIKAAIFCHYFIKTIQFKFWKGHEDFLLPFSSQRLIFAVFICTNILYLTTMYRLGRQLYCMVEKGGGVEI